MKSDSCASKELLISVSDREPSVVNEKETVSSDSLSSVQLYGGVDVIGEFEGSEG